MCAKEKNILIFYNVIKKYHYLQVTFRYNNVAFGLKIEILWYIKSVIVIVVY